MVEYDPQREADLDEKYGLSNGSGCLGVEIPKDALYRTAYISEDKKIWIYFMDKNHKVLADLWIPGMVYAETVKEYKVKGDSKGGWEEVTQHRVFILLKTGQRQCPWCGHTDEYNEYDRASYISDHRAGQCVKCLRYSFVTHDHIEGRCQEIVLESLINYKKI